MSKMKATIKHSVYDEDYDYNKEVDIVEVVKERGSIISSILDSLKELKKIYE